MITKIDLTYISIIITILIYTYFKPFDSTTHVMELIYGFVGFSYPIMKVLFKNDILFGNGLVKIILITVIPDVIAMFLISYGKEIRLETIAWYLLVTIYLIFVIFIAYVVGYFFTKSIFKQL
ncbi:hypothetical protein HLVA_22270 (plasmid) [Haliovirga abyssi]|uniref:CidA/LrgA family protein n=2 Tax=Haliovirga abyssi TaxID=2996794 RepID=A0AAU9DSQ1_9FUSO|nr:hypothetical protein HLVA_22270 [Haliovirga abyssi]